MAPLSEIIASQLVMSDDDFIDMDIGHHHLKSYQQCERRRGEQVPQHHEAVILL